MVNRTRARRRRLGAVLAGVLLVGAAVLPQAMADDGVRGGGDARGTYREGNNSCYLVSTPGYLGGRCVKLGGGTVLLTIKELLAGDPLPECWDSRLTQRELDGLRLVNDDGYVWYWNKCLEGIDPVTFEVDPDKVNITTELVRYKRPEYVITTLTDNQQKVVERYNEDDVIPMPVLGVSPDALPLVNNEVSFFNFGASQLTVRVPVIDIEMRAQIDRMKVLPEGRPGPVVTCDDIGYQAAPGETKKDHPQGCWYTYKRSSLDLPNDVYAAEVHTHWVVHVRRPGGGWELFNAFWKGSYWNIGVNEVQAVVVP